MNTAIYTDQRSANIGSVRDADDCDSRSAAAAPQRQGRPRRDPVEVSRIT